MSPEQAFFAGLGCAAILIGVAQQTWQHAMRHCRKIERLGIRLQDWHEDQGDPLPEPKPQETRIISSGRFQ